MNRSEKKALLIFLPHLPISVIGPKLLNLEKVLMFAVIKSVISPKCNEGTIYFYAKYYRLINYFSYKVR